MGQHLARFIARRSLLSVLAALMIALTLPHMAQAADLESARSQGMVGERADGLIGAISNTPDITALVQTVNAARMASYKEIAGKEGTKLDAVQAIAGAKQVQKARESGWYYMDASGAWKKG